MMKPARAVILMTLRTNSTEECQVG
jgi:hypothetical protein